MTLAINTGLEPSARDELAAGLSKLLADTYGAYLKTHGYHWNVRGPNFGTLHTLFMQQYAEVWAAIDTVAERIRALGGVAPQGYRAFANLSAIADGDPELDAEAMLRDLLKSHEALIATARSLRPAADAAGDEATVALIDDRLAAHEKHVWMLRASLGLK